MNTIYTDAKLSGIPTDDNCLYIFITDEYETTDKRNIVTFDNDARFETKTNVIVDIEGNESCLIIDETKFYTKGDYVDGNNRCRIRDLTFNPKTMRFESVEHCKSYIPANTFFCTEINGDRLTFTRASILLEKTRGD